MRNISALNGRNGRNGNGNGAHPVSPDNVTHNDGAEQPPSMASSKVVRTEAFDQPVILQQTSLWSRAIVLGIVGVTSFVILWASFARIEEAVPATGKLESQERTQEIQAPVGGVVTEILVEDGQRVNRGDVLVRFDTTAAAAQKRSLEQIRTSLQQENAFYRSQMSGGGAANRQSGQSNLPPEMLSLTINRATLLSEIQLYQTQLTGATDSTSLTPEQQLRLRSGLSESQSAISAARLEVSQLQEQLNQTQTQLVSARSTLAVEESILGDIQPLVEEGGLARIQGLRQEQTVVESRSKVQELVQEQQRLQFAINGAYQKYQNTVALSRNDLLNRIAENQKQVATIDSQLNKAIVDNEKQIAEIERQRVESQVTLDYQELRAPIDGVIFDLQAKGTGFVANTSEPILKIVPTEALLAEVYITNQDIGFVREGMTVDVRVDSFPFSEFGDIKGTVTRIGSDALPPDQIHQFYRFPAQITLDQQFLEVGGQDVQLQSGMSVTANIITRDRTIMSIFTDLFSRRIESLKTVR